jgi:hypothetical protein
MHFFKFYENIKSEAAAGKSKIWAVLHYEGTEGRYVQGETLYSNEAAAKSQEDSYNRVEEREVVGNYTPGQPIYSTTWQYDNFSPKSTTYYANKEDAAKGGERVDTHQVFSTPQEAWAHKKKQAAAQKVASQAREEKEIAEYPQKLHRLISGISAELTQMATQLKGLLSDNISDDDISAAWEVCRKVELAGEHGMDSLRHIISNYRHNVRERDKRLKYGK